MRAVIPPHCDCTKPHSCRQQIIEHLESKVPRTDPQKLEIQERRNTVARRFRTWKTAQAVYMPQVIGFQPDEQGLFASGDLDELEESKPELWSLFLPSQLSEGDRSSSHKGVTETELALRLAQARDNLVDLRRLRRTLRSMKMFFKSNVVGEGQKTQTKSRASESTVTVRINRAVRRYRLAYTALLSLDPTGDWRKEFLELTDKDNRGPGKELGERGVGDGRYAMSWIWTSGGDHAADSSDQEVNETVRHEWMTCRARADRWREELDLLQEEMRRVIAFLEWKSSWWVGKVGSRSSSATADIQHGIDAYARKQASTYHLLAVSLANQWLPHLLEWKLDITWAKVYPWAIGITHVQGEGSSSTQENPSSSDPSVTEMGHPSTEQSGGINPADPSDDGDESDGEDHLGVDGGILDEGEDSDALAIGFEYDDRYMS